MRLDQALAHLCEKFPRPPSQGDGGAACCPQRYRWTESQVLRQVTSASPPSVRTCPLIAPHAGRINGPFRRARGPPDRVCCGLKPSHLEPHSLRPQPINLNIIKNGGIHSRNRLCSPSRLGVHSWRLCLLPGTADTAPVSDDEDCLLRGCNHHEGCGLNP